MRSTKNIVRNKILSSRVRLFRIVVINEKFFSSFFFFFCKHNSLNPFIRETNKKITFRVFRRGKTRQYIRTSIISMFIPSPRQQKTLSSGNRIHRKKIRFMYLLGVGRRRGNMIMLPSNDKVQLLSALFPSSAYPYYAFNIKSNISINLKTPRQRLRNNYNIIIMHLMHIYAQVRYDCRTSALHVKI